MRLQCAALPSENRCNLVEIVHRGMNPSKMNLITLGDGHRHNQASGLETSSLDRHDLESLPTRPLHAIIDEPAFSVLTTVRAFERLSPGGSVPVNPRARPPWS